MEEIKTYLVPNEMCRRTGIASTFISTYQLGVFPSQLVKWHQKDIPSAYVTTTSASASIFQVRKEIILFQPILRRLVNESAGVFLQLQSQIANNTLDPKQGLLQYSIQYRSIIRAALEMLQEEIMSSEGLEKEDLHQQITVFYSAECIWHLCEILYIQNIPGNVVKNHLLEWVRFHIPKYERKAFQLMSDQLGIGLECQPDYWPTITGCLLQGRLDAVCSLLEMHSNASMNCFRLALQVLRTMPLYDLSEGVSVNEFNLQRKHWLVDTQAKIDAKMFLSEKKVEFLMRLVVGEEMAWNEVQDTCEEWYEYLAAWLFYTEPTVKTFELGRYAKKCVQRLNTTLKYLDRVLLAAMEKDMELIAELQCMNDSGWFVTHLIDLFYHAGQLESWKTDETSCETLRESFILEYAALLMDHHSLWQVGLTYLDCCPVQGLSYVEVLLPRVATNEKKGEMVMREAHKRSLPHLGFSVAKIQCRDAMKRDQLGNALLWALKSQDSEYISHLVDKLLTHYAETNNLLCADLIANLGPSILATDSLVFLGKYYDFRVHFSANQMHKAASVLISLIRSKFTPKYFWSVLLSDTLPLLESKETVFSANDLMILLNCLEERAKSLDMKEKIVLIRIAIARNLSKVFVRDTY